MTAAQRRGGSRVIHSSADMFRLDFSGTKRENVAQNKTSTETIPMFQIAREGLALVSVAGFVWMVCQLASLAG